MSSRANILIDQGTTFSTTVQINMQAGPPIDLTTYTIESLVKKDYSSVNSFSFATSGSNAGIITLSLDANTSLSVDPGRYLYDLVIVANTGEKTRILEGQVTLYPSVSR
jgi:hypothetical protein